MPFGFLCLSWVLLVLWIRRTRLAFTGDLLRRNRGLASSGLSEQVFSLPRSILSLLSYGQDDGSRKQCLALFAKLGFRAVFDLAVIAVLPLHLSEDTFEYISARSLCIR